MRIALHSVIARDSIEAYRAEHQRVPADLVALFDRAGIHDWTIWRSGDRLFHLVECDDYDQAMRIVDPDPANLAWQGQIGRFVDHFRGPDGQPDSSPLDQVWRLTEQR